MSVAAPVRTRDELWRDLAQQAWDRAGTAANPAEARRWLERARRIQPRDDTIALSLATLLLEADAFAEAADLFAGVAERHDVAEAWVGLAACLRNLGQPGRAACALHAALSRTVPIEAALALAAPVAAEAGMPGWCWVDRAGRLHTGRCEATAVRTPGRIAVTQDGVHLLGSPVDLAAIGVVEGMVERHGGALRGWAWRPGDPAADPVVFVNGEAVRLQTASSLRLERPFARPRALDIPLSRLGAIVEVRGSDGRLLLGSPLHTAPGPPPRPASRRGRPAAGIAVVIPVYGNAAAALACIAAVLATVPPDTLVHVADDASTDRALAAALDGLAQDGRIRLTRLAQNRGFPGAANAGLRACADRDAVLLNSDTLVPPGWLGRLRAAAHSAADVASATPLSNDATILSYPDRAGGNPVPNADDVAALDAIAQRANGTETVDIPTGVGFCLYIRRDALDAVGPLREDVFAQGYGEENEWCRRAAGLGFRHVAALGVFVGHAGGGSFGSARAHLLRRNMAEMDRLHPGYGALVAAHVRADPLAIGRRRMDALRWADARDSVVLLTHAGGGGVDRVVAARCDALRREGVRPVVLRPRDGRCAVDGFPNLAFALPEELDGLMGLLRSARPRHVELHHALGHAPAVLALAAGLGVALDVFVHDYALFCPRIALVGGDGRYCGEPAVAGCVACVAGGGSHLEEPVAVPALVARSAAVLSGARRVVTPSADAATRLLRHFNGVQAEVLPWEDDGAWPPLAPNPGGDVRRVLVPGAIGIEKGYATLLGLVRDAAARRLPLEFVIVGHTVDDGELMAAGPAFVTGPYREADAAALIRAQHAHLAFIPSVWPETWCFALSRAWEAGLPVAAFDLGAPAERIRRTGRGWVLPTDLAPAALNDALLRLPLSPTRPRVRHNPATHPATATA